MEVVEPPPTLRPTPGDGDGEPAAAIIDERAMFLRPPTATRKLVPVFRNSGQAMIVDGALRTRRRNNGSVMSYFESVRRDYMGIRRKRKRQQEHIGVLRKRLEGLRVSFTHAHNRLCSFLFDSNTKIKPEMVSKSVARLAKRVERLEANLENMEKELPTKEETDSFNDTLTRLADAFVKQGESHNQNISKWMYMRMNADNPSLVGSGVTKRPGRISFSPFTLHDPVYDHVDIKKVSGRALIGQGIEGVGKRMGGGRRKGK
jgi:hypothetical protein